jgi:hypothetical protein
MPYIFSLNTNRANKAVITGTVAITTLPVAAVTVSSPLLKAIMYKKNPTAPAARNHGRSALFGSFILVWTAIAAKVQDAVKYLRKPNEKAEKYCNAILVNTYANDQKMIVVIA